METKPEESTVVSQAETLMPLMEALVQRGLLMALPKQKLQFVRTKGIAIKDDYGEFIREDVNDPASPAIRGKGHRRGVLIAFLDEEDSKEICIGYSLCHKNDRFDYKNGTRVKGLGAYYAYHKAKKHKNTSAYLISSNCVHKSAPKSIIKIPQSIQQDLQEFIYRCSKYYKDRIFPRWAVNFALNGEQPTLPEPEPDDDVA